MCLSYFAVVHCMKILSLAINHCFFRTAAPAPLCRSLHRRRKLWCFYSLHKINHEYHKLIHSVSARLYSNWTWTHRLSAKKQEAFFCRESSVMNGNDKSQCVRVYVCQNKMCKSHVILSITAFYVYFFSSCAGIITKILRQQQKQHWLQNGEKIEFETFDLHRF